VGPVRVGVIGTGMMGVEHLCNLAHLPGAVVTAIADPNADSRRIALGACRAAGSASGGVVAFSEHRALLESGLCDAVVIATPNHTHHDILLCALATDLAVLVEKPLCITVADCHAIVKAAAQRSALTWVGMEYRYMPPVARLIADVHAGAVGRVRMVAIREHRFPFLDKVGRWNRFNRYTGGTLVEKCCHFFDLMGLVLQSPPVRVCASGAQSVNHLEERYAGERPDVLDNAYVIVDYASGARAVLDLCMFAEATTEQEEVVVVGDAGKAEAFLPSGRYRLGLRRDGQTGVTETMVTDDRIAYEGLHHGASYLEHVAFLHAVRTGATPAVSVSDGLLAVAVGVAAHRSISESRVVSLDEVLESRL
jgi:myo-inositol 2-dehydrogenase/D-chiro-inositol 1-dehydrogenase